MPASKTKSPYKVQVLDRALEILAALADHPSDCTLAELCTDLKLHKSTLHRLITVLEQHRLVDKNPDTGRYRLGMRLFELGSKAVAVVDLRGASRPFLDQLLRETHETVHLCVLDRDEVVYLEKLEPQRSVRLTSRVGHRNPAYCTAVGKAILAELPDAEVTAILRRSGMKRLTPKTLTTLAAMHSELASVRSCGYAVDDEEHEEGVRCVGAVVRDHAGKPVAAISASGPAFRLSNEKVPEVAESVMRAANALSRELGYSIDGPARAGPLAS